MGELDATTLGAVAGAGMGLASKTFDLVHRRMDHRQTQEQVKQETDTAFRMAEKSLTKIAPATPAPENDLDRPSHWVVNLRSMVRPVFTFFFLLEFFILTALLAAGTITEHQYQIIWDNEIQGIFSCLVTFWFMVKRDKK